MKQKDLKYEAGKYKYDFQQYEAIRYFGESIYPGTISIHKTHLDQIILLENMVKFSTKSRPKKKQVRIKNKIFLIE